MIVDWIILIIAGLLIAGSIWFLVEKRQRRTQAVTGGIQQDIILPYEQEVELYCNAFSHCSRKTRLAIAELAIAHKHLPIDLIETGWYQTISAAYLKINPSGLVPTLVHKGRQIYESDDILIYAQSLAKPDAPMLYPDNPDKRLEVERWLAFCNLNSDDPMAGMAQRAGACIAPLTLPMFITSIKYISFRRILISSLFHPDKKDQRSILLPNCSDFSLLAKVLPPSYFIQRAHIAAVSLLLRLDETGWLEHFAARHKLASLARIL
ncbi:MAG: hypothetical protein ACJAVI_003234 [Candidatus Azotimanducaceae bacterium]